MSNPLHKIPVAAARGFFRVLQGAGHYRFPPTVRIESTNLCNARCVTCTRDIMTRDKGVMDFALYKKIIDECAGQRVRSVHLHNFGEPLMDKGIYERIQYATDKGLKARMFTNLSLMNEEAAEKLVKSGLDRLKGSIDGNSRETFEQARQGLSFETVTKNIETLLQVRQRLGSWTPRIGLTYVETSENREETRGFLKRWRGKVDFIDFTSYHNWGGELGSGRHKPMGLPCPRIWQTFTILWNGDVSICCMDYDGTTVLGNVRDDSIASVFNGPVMAEIRRWHLRGEFQRIPICLGCEARK